MQLFAIDRLDNRLLPGAAQLYQVTLPDGAAGGGKGFFFYFEVQFLLRLVELPADSCPGIAATVRLAGARAAVNELDIRGLMTDEADLQVERFIDPDLLPNIKQHPPESSFLPAGIAFLMVCAPNGGFPMVRAGTGLLF